jgi:type II secretory pathway pseudopilin PulG
MPFLLMLLTVALSATGLAQLGERWQVQMQREREVELLFRGQQIRAALQAYQLATPAGQPALPQDLGELLQDRRGETTRHWLRQLYPDPFTGQPDWQLLRDRDGSILGVHSRSDRPALQRHALPVAAQPAQGDVLRVSDWRFVVERSAPASTRRPNEGLIRGQSRFNRTSP